MSPSPRGASRVPEVEPMRLTTEITIAIREHLVGMGLWPPQDKNGAANGQNH